jgi:DNA-binding CsgD family transcriptional regulator
MGLSVESSHGARDRRPRWRLWDTFPQQERAEILETLEHASRLLTPEAMPAMEDIHDFGAATLALNTAWTAISRAVNGDHAAIEAITSAGDLIQLLFRIHGAESIIQRIESQRRTGAVATVREALSLLRDAGSVQELTDRCPKVVSELGFDRTMLSLIDQSVWIPQSAYVDGDSEWADEIVESGQGHPQQLVSSLPEFELLGRRKGILVTNAQHNTKVYKQIVAPSLSRSYVAAALKSEGQVTGFLHCDQFFHHREASEFDRDLLNLFAEGFSYVLERAILLDRAAAVRAEVEESARRISAATGGFGGGAFVRAAGSQAQEHRPVKPSAPHRPAFDAYGLTRRETEVLRLMVDGKGNSHIADSLVISPGTVKSHVKHILRKLGVTNRAEAIACWFNTRDTGGAAVP